MTRLRPAALAAATAVAVLAACGPARTGEPILGPLQLTGRAEQGEVVFNRYCTQCHPGGEPGIGVGLSNDHYYPDPFVRLQVRQGFGKMPAFEEEVISDDELGALIAYLHELREWRRNP